MPDERDEQDVADEKDEIDKESATVLPNREAMSVIDPTFVPRLVTTATDPNATTGQGIDESNPEGDA